MIDKAYLFFVERNRFGQAVELGSGNAAKCEAFASGSDDARSEPFHKQGVCAHSAPV